MSSENLLLEYIPFAADIDKINESIKNNNGKILITGVLQRADARNQNGRIYPKNILAREVKKYMESFVPKRALGELDHPDCLSPIKIMTYGGWKDIKNISETEKVAVLDTDSKKMKFEQIQRKIDIPYNGQMIHIKNGGSIDMKVTPTHRMLLYDRNNKPYYITAVEFYNKHKNKDSLISHSYLLKTGGNWEGKDVPYIEIGDYVKIKTEDFCAFLGIYIAEGNSPLYRNEIRITQKNERVKSEIRKLIKKLPFNFYETDRYKNNTTIDFISSNKYLKEYLHPLGKSYEKYIPQEIKDLAPKYLNIFIDWLLKGDGRNRKKWLKEGQNLPDIHRELATTSERLANDVSEIFFKLGSVATINKYYPKDRYIGGRLIKSENSRPLFIVSEGSSKASYLDNRFITADLIDYDEDRVYCVTTSTGNWLANNNNKIFWTGNSSVVNLSNVSHNIVEMHWKDDDVVGTIEVLNTPAGKILQELLKAGIEIGISSRGLGSVKENENGESVVQEDFELVAFDMVSNPSTHGAFMHSLRESVDKYGKSCVNKYCRIQELVTDILIDMNENLNLEK